MIKEKLAGWGNYPVSESILLTPYDEQEFKKAFQQDKLIARGLGRSYGDQALNAGHQVARCTRLNRFISWDATEGILTCQAGVSLEDIINVFAHDLPRYQIRYDRRRHCQ